MLSNTVLAFDDMYIVDKSIHVINPNITNSTALPAEPEPKNTHNKMPNMIAKSPRQKDSNKMENTRSIVKNGRNSFSTWSQNVVQSDRATLPSNMAGIVVSIPHDFVQRGILADGMMVIK
jgi:hypothetical protein